MKNKFVSRYAQIDGAKIHYTLSGSGAVVILLHGFAETSRMWIPILPSLGEKFTVIAPDLPGIGNSSIPGGGIGMKTAAIQIHDLVRSLDITKTRVVGHDIGLMVAYAYAALSRVSPTGIPRQIKKERSCGNLWRASLSIAPRLAAPETSGIKPRLFSTVSSEIRPKGVPRG